MSKKSEVAIGLARAQAGLRIWRDNLAKAKKDKDDAAIGVAQSAIEGLREEQETLLKQLSGASARRPIGGNGPTNDAVAAADDGWAIAARTLDLSNGVNRVELAGDSLLRPLRSMAGLNVTPSSNLSAPQLHGPFVEIGQDRRYLYPTLPRGELDAEALAISDFKQSGARKTGTATAATDVVNVTAHGFAAGERVVFLALTGGAGLTLGTAYFVMASGLTANAFKVAATSGGSAIDITSDATALTVMNLESIGRTVTGSVERDPVATTDKATVDLSIDLATDPVRQFAALVENVPLKLFEAVPVLEAFLKSELQYQIERGLDAHTVARILATAPLTGSTGQDLIAKARNALAVLRDVGANPTVLAVSPTDAATLDLTKTTDGLYLFLTREAGAASPLWALQVVEVAGLTSPIVIDPVMLGILYVHTGLVVLDPYTGLKQNTVRVRAEVEALTHIRNANGAYVIA